MQLYCVCNLLQTYYRVEVALTGHQGAPAVSLAGILPGVSSADHAGGDHSTNVVCVRATALAVSHSVHINLLQ